MELHDMLKTVESNMAKAKPTAVVLTIKEGGIRKKKTTTPKGKGKEKVGTPNSVSKPKPKVADQSSSKIPKAKDSQEATCFQCGEKGHMRHVCPVYLKELNELWARGVVNPSGTFMIELNNTSISISWVLDTGGSTHICTNVQGLTGNRVLKAGELDLIMEN